MSRGKINITDEKLNFYNTHPNKEFEEKFKIQAVAFRSKAKRLGYSVVNKLPKVPIQIRNKICELYVKGSTREAIEKETGYNKSCNILRDLKSWGYDVPTKIPKLDKTLIKREYERTKSKIAIARMLCSTPSRIAKYLEKELGIPINKENMHKTKPITMTCYYSKSNKKYGVYFNCNKHLEHFYKFFFREVEARQCFNYIKGIINEDNFCQIKEIVKKGDTPWLCR